MCLFLSTPSARRATLASLPLLQIQTYFYPRPLRGGRPSHALLFSDQRAFLSTPSARRATDHRLRPHRQGTISIHALCEEGDPYRPSERGSNEKFLSTPSARRATLEPQHTALGVIISIHALCEEGDGTLSTMRRQKDISIHALCEEGDTSYRVRTTADVLFLSTPSARRATLSLFTRTRAHRNFYPRPLRGGRPAALRWSWTG